MSLTFDKKNLISAHPTQKKNFFLLTYKNPLSTSKKPPPKKSPLLPPRISTDIAVHNRWPEAADARLFAGCVTGDLGGGRQTGRRPGARRTPSRDACAIERAPVPKLCRADRKISET